MFGTDIFGFCALMKSFFYCIAIATEFKNEGVKCENRR